jgi:hypothetical protein
VDRRKELYGPSRQRKNGAQQAISSKPNKKIAKMAIIL